jgi:hypothetical protein
MAKQPTEQRPTNENGRFSDWTIEGLIIHDRDEKLVPDKDNEDPNVLPNTGASPVPDKK